MTIEIDYAFSDPVEVEILSQSQRDGWTGVLKSALATWIMVSEN